MQNINTKIKAITAVGLSLILAVALCISVGNAQKAGADEKDGIDCYFSVVDTAQPSEEGKIALEISGSGVNADMIIDFGDNIECDEGDFFAMPEDDWNGDDDYFLDELSPGVYNLKATDYDGTLSIEISGTYLEDGVNTVSVEGTYFPVNGGGEQTISCSVDTIVGAGEPEEEPEEVIEETVPSEETVEAEKIEPTEEKTEEPTETEEVEPTEEITTTKEETNNVDTETNMDMTEEIQNEE